MSASCSFPVFRIQLQKLPTGRMALAASDSLDCCAVLLAINLFGLDWCPHPCGHQSNHAATITLRSKMEAIDACHTNLVKRHHPGRRMQPSPALSPTKAAVPTVFLRDGRLRRGREGLRVLSARHKNRAPPPTPPRAVSFPLPSSFRNCFILVS